MAIIKNPLIVISGGGGNQPTLFTPYLSIDYVTSILTISDGNGDFASYDLYYDNNGVWTLVASGLGKNINLSTYFPTHNSDISLKVQAKGTDFISSDYSSVVVWQYGVGTPRLAYTLSNDGTYYICSGIGTATDTDIEIGSIYEGLPVTRIAQGAFGNNATITSVIMPDSITFLGSSAFGRCSNLTSVRLSENLTEILGYTFQYCPIQSINIPNKVISLSGQSTFLNCTQLTEATLSDSLTYLGKYTFSTCNLTEIILPETLTYIGEQAFASNSNLQKIVFLSKTAPTSGGRPFAATSSNKRIYVPYLSIEEYKITTNLALYESIMYPLVDTVSDLQNIDTTSYIKACVVGNEDYTEYQYTNNQWEVVQ